MSAPLNVFLNQPETTDPWANLGSSTLHCIIDSVRQPRALEQLYQQDGLNGIERLFQSTPFADMNDVSPLWLPLKKATPIAAKAIALCRDNRSGLLLTSSAKPGIALLHARRLLRMHSHDQGGTLARFYDPAFWSALALTAAEPTLYGPWERVLTPPAHPDDQAWRVWEPSQPAQASSNEAGHPLLLHDRTLTLADDIRRWYWVRAREAESAKRLLDAQLPTVLENLSLLVAHGIDEGRHLERLLSRLDQYRLHDRPDFMDVLSSQMPAFEKVQRLEI